MQKSSPLRFLALGDSYTIGEAVEPSQRWPVQLATKLRERGLAIEEPEIVAMTGWTTDELDRAIDDAPISPPYDLVSLLVGVNNQYRGRRVDEYRGQFSSLLRRAIGFAGGEPARTLVLSIPDWGTTEFARKEKRDAMRVAAEIDLFNAANREEAERARARWIDVTAISRRAAADASLLASDGLHPSGKMYDAWSDAALPVVLAMFR